VRNARTKRKPPPFRLVAPVVREHPIHKAIAQVLALELAPAGRVSAEGVVWWSIDLASYMGGIPLTHLQRGCVAGIADIFLLHTGRSHFMEVKATDGEMSWPQRSLAAAIVGAGGRVAVVRNAIDACRCLDEWHIPRRHRTAL
jgi:hypothetical protein